MTTFVSRDEWGARTRGSGTTQINPTEGVTVHYEGDGWVWPWDHSTCDDKVRAMQAYHMDIRGWSDIAYNYLGCPHNYCYEGRGYDRRSSANGNEYANSVSFAVQAMWGERAGAKVPDNLKRAVRFVIDLLRSKGGASSKLHGHRDWKSTSCPGDELYEWVKQGCPLPYVAPPTPTIPTTPEECVFTLEELGTVIDQKLQKYTVADNNHDGQVIAWHVTAQAYASKRFAEGADFETVKNEVWSKISPLWS